MVWFVGVNTLRYGDAPAHFASTTSHIYLSCFITVKKLFETMEQRIDTDEFTPKKTKTVLANEKVVAMAFGIDKASCPSIILKNAKQ